MVIPSLEEVKKLAKDHNVIPVCRSVLADTETPVSVWMKLFSNEKYSFLLESISGEEAVARYSFLGGKPYMRFVSNPNGGKSVVKLMKKVPVFLSRNFAVLWLFINRQEFPDYHVLPVVP